MCDGWGGVFWVQSGNVIYDTAPETMNDFLEVCWHLTIIFSFCLLFPKLSTSLFNPILDFILTKCMYATHLTRWHQGLSVRYLRCLITNELNPCNKPGVRLRSFPMASFQTLPLTLVGSPIHHMSLVLLVFFLPFRGEVWCSHLMCNINIMQCINYLSKTYCYSLNVPLTLYKMLS